MSCVLSCIVFLLENPLNKILLLVSATNPILFCALQEIMHILEGRRRQLLAICKKRPVMTDKECDAL